MTADIKNLSASIRQRLKNKADEQGVPFNEVLQRYAIERFLYRLGESPYRDAFVLKGAQMLVVWRVKRTRPTMDVDLLGFTENSLKNLETIAKALCALDTEGQDALCFDPESVETMRIKEDAEYEGVRLAFEAKLGAATVHMQVDIGFDDAVFPGPLDIRYPSLLGLPEPALRAYSRESVVAEKFEAMVKLGGRNSRMKDFFDIWLLSQQFSFCSHVLSKAICATFERRGTLFDDMPVTLDPAFSGKSEKQAQWSAFLRRHRLDYAPAHFVDVAASIAAFIGPVVDSVRSGDDTAVVWKSGGSWESET